MEISPRFFRFAAPAFFALVVVTGLIAVPSYGISWDEKAMFVLGLRAFNYVFEDGTYPVSTAIRYHGSWFELFLYGIPKWLGIHYARDIFMLRHFLNYLTFAAGIGGFYYLGRRYLGSGAWGLVAAVMLFLSPRQFGHAFYNGRDIPNMALWILSVLTMLRMLEVRSPSRIILHAVFCGMAIALRIAGVFLPVLSLTMLGISLYGEWRRGDRTAVKQTILTACILVVAVILATVAFWPLLWEQPFHNFFAALHNMAKEQNAAGGLSFGVHGGAKWHWIPGWIAVTTPWPYLVLFLAGIAFTARELLRGWRTMLQSPHVPVVAWFFGPLLAIIILESPVFDEWRHVYFIYPALLLTACMGAKQLLDAGIRKFGRTNAVRAFLVLAALHIAFTGFWMIRNHPFQYVYFSIPSRFVEGNFELDYWGISYKQGFEKVLEMDPAEKIPVVVYGSSGTDNMNMLTREQRRRLLIHARDDFRGKYLLDNFRGRGYARQFPEEDKVASITVSGIEILAIYKNPNWDRSTFDPRMYMDDTMLMLGIDGKLME